MATPISETLLSLDILQEAMDNPLLSVFYVADEAALALHQGYNNLETFNLYSSQCFNSGKIAEWLTTSYKISLIRIGYNIIETRFDNLYLTFGLHPYPLLEEPVSIQGIRTAGLKDLAAKSMFDIVNGPNIYNTNMTLLQRYFSIKQMLELFKIKYPGLELEKTENIANHFMCSKP